MRRVCALAALRCAARPVAASVSMKLCPRAAFAAGALVQPMRFTSLSQLAKDELDEETTHEREMPAVPEGWKLEQTPGEACFTLKKSYNDEKIVILSQLQAMDPELAERRQEGDESPNVHFPFTALITRNGKTIDFSLTHIDGEMCIDGMAHYNSPAVAADQSAEGQSRRDRMYQGPTFAELSHTFVDGVVGYLEERGVNDDLSTFVAQYSYWLEQTEYENWLRSIVDFTK